MELLALLIVTYALLAFLLDRLRRSEVALNLQGRTLLPRRFGSASRARVALAAAATAIGEGEDPGRVADSLRSLDLEGRARLCRDVAVRCLEGATRYERVEGRLKREAAGWVKMAFKELRK